MPYSFNSLRTYVGKETIPSNPEIYGMVHPDTKSLLFHNIVGHNGLDHLARSLPCAYVTKPSSNVAARRLLSFHAP